MVKKVVMQGIDLSHWNIVSDWDKVSDAVDFVMLKIGGEEGEAGVFKPDPKFLEYYHSAVKSGLHVGGYFFAGHKREIIRASANEIKKMCVKIDDFLKQEGVVFDMPIAIDFENQDKTIKLSNTDYVLQWCETMESLNYYVTIYASDISGFEECLIPSKLYMFDKWVARYRNSGPEILKYYGMWQYTSTGVVDGIRGNVDMNYAYLNYPAIIIREGLNI